MPDDARREGMARRGPMCGSIPSTTGGAAVKVVTARCQPPVRPSGKAISSGPRTSTGSLSVSMTQRRFCQTSTMGSDDHQFFLALPGFDQSSGFEHGGPGAHDRAERHRAPGDNLGLQPGVSKALEGDVLVAQCGMDHQDHPLWSEQIGSFGAEAIHDQSPVQAPVPAAADPVPRQRIVGSRNVGRVGQDEIELLAGYRPTQVPPAHCARHPTQTAVKPRRSNRAQRQIHRSDRSRASPCGGQRQRPGASADIQHTAASRIATSVQNLDQERGVAVDRVHPWRPYQTHDSLLPATCVGKTAALRVLERSG